jgi:FkbM family methyltransferase
MNRLDTVHLRYQRAKWRLARWLRHRLRLARPSEVIERRNGLRWALDPSDYQQASFLWLWERWDTYHVCRLAKEDGVILDIGANFGYYAITLAAGPGSRRTIHAFEPNATTFDRLQRNIGLNALANVIAHRVALSDQVGTAGVRVVNPVNSGSTQLTEGDSVVVTTIDAFCRTQEIDRLDFLKIDVEGYENRVLRGGAATLARFRPAIMIELNPPVLRTTDSSVDQVVGTLNELGYALFRAERRELVPLAVEDVPDGSFINAFCIPRG